MLLFLSLFCGSFHLQGVICIGTYWFSWCLFIFGPVGVHSFSNNDMFCVHLSVKAKVQGVLHHSDYWYVLCMNALTVILWCVVGNVHAVIRIVLVKLAVHTVYSNGRMRFSHTLPPSSLDLGISHVPLVKIDSPVVNKPPKWTDHLPHGAVVTVWCMCVCYICFSMVLVQ